MQIDLEAAAEKMEAVKPRMVMVGANIFLFPYPLEELAEAARRVGAVLVYDAAMVLGLILGGHFQNPLAGGANVVTASTHKTFPGPQGGILFGKGEFGDRIEEASRSCFSNFHPHRILGVAVALAEMEAFGDTYAAQTVANAKTLASALCAKGMDVLCEGSGFTQTHQVVADCSAIGGAEKASAVLSQANIITSPFQIPRDDGTDNVSGLVLGTAEVTRLGMGESEMVEIARCIHRMVTGKSAPHRARAEVAELREPFQKIDYCFDEERQAYEYFGTEAGKT